MSDKQEPGGDAAADPSMDDILASIRRILDEEEKEPGQASKHSGEPDDEEVLELEPSMMVPEPDEAAPGPVPVPPPILSEPLPLAERVPLPDPGVPVPLPPLPVSAALMAPAAAAAASVGALMRSLASERSAATHRGGPTIEDVVREEMRPLLKDWLDTHLAPMVERLVRAEIERVVSRIT